jgi:nucleoside-diphosphate-sugar epimerase
VKKYNILFLGGNRFFGKEIIKCLLKYKHNVTVLNRSNRKNIFHKNLNIISCDRENYKKLDNILKYKQFDIVIDNIAYKPRPVQKLLKILDSKIGLYICSSTMMAYFDYSLANVAKENSKIKNLKTNKMVSFYNRGEIDYAKNKLKIEKFLKKTKTNYIILRFHNIIGQNDFTDKTFKFINFNFMKKKYHYKKFQFIYEDDIIRLIRVLIKNPYKIRRKTYNVANDAIKITSLKKIINFKFNTNFSNKINFPYAINNLIDNNLIQKDYNFKFSNSIKVLKKLKIIFKV